MPEKPRSLTHKQRRRDFTARPDSPRHCDYVYIRTLHGYGRPSIGTPSRYFTCSISGYGVCRAVINYGCCKMAAE